MTAPKRDVDALLRVFRIHLTSPQTRQLLKEIGMSRVGLSEITLGHAMSLLVDALDSQDALAKGSIK